MRIIKIGAIGAAVVGLVLAGAAATWATGSHPSPAGAAGPLVGHQTKHQVTAVGEVLKKTVLANGFSGAALAPAGFTAIDAGETIVCPGAGTCTIDADMNVQAQGTGSSNAWAICLNVDAAVATCPYYGFLDSAFFDNGHITETISGVTPGAHTVKTTVFSTNGGTAYNYNFVYHVYKP